MKADLFMIPRPFTFSAEAAIPAARPRAPSAGYTLNNFPLKLQEGLENSFQCCHCTQAAAAALDCRQDLLEKVRDKQQPKQRRKLSLRPSV